MTVPIASPSDIIGYITWELFLFKSPFFVIGTEILLLFLLSYISLSSIILSMSLLISCSKYSFFDPPDTAITVSLSVMHAICPVVFANVSAYSVANSDNSPIGEYFFKITCPSLSVNISSGSPFFYSKCLSYFFWYYNTS